MPRGLAQVWELRHDGEVVGVEVNLNDARRYYSWMGAYEPEVAQLGLGKLAIGESIRESIEAGRSYYDLMVGDEEYKYWYGATDRYCRWMMVGTAAPAHGRRSRRAPWPAGSDASQRLRLDRDFLLAVGRGWALADPRLAARLAVLARAALLRGLARRCSRAGCRGSGSS